MIAEPKKNIFLFYGEDGFSLRQKIQIWKEEFAKKFSPQGIATLNSEGLSDLEMQKKLEEALSPSLFAAKKLVVARNFLPTKASQADFASALERILAALPSDFFLVFWQDSLDKRLGFVKKLLKEANVTEFCLPHGRDLNAWILRQAHSLGLSLDQAAAEKLAVMSGRDLYEEKKIGGRVIERKEFFSLWQIYSELQKLAAYSGAPTAEDVGRLTSPVVSENVFALSDAIVSQNKKAALEVFERLIDNENSAEKSTSIKLLGLVSEQIRSQLMVNLLKKQNMDQNQIASFLGWSPGRVFVTLKNSGNFQLTQLKQLLGRLLSADAQIKSSEANPKLLIDLLIAK